jgi:hypothetical protein
MAAGIKHIVDIASTAPQIHGPNAAAAFVRR